jgi:hypothetical protein
MHCHDQHCSSNHCLIDRAKDKHYRLFPHHLEYLTWYAKRGNKLENQDDVPEDFRRQLETEELQELQQQKKTKSSLQPIPPIHITNVLPEKSDIVTPKPPRLEIPPPLNEAISKYTR